MLPILVLSAMLLQQATPAASAPAALPPQQMPVTTTNPAFDSLKALAGTWSGDGPEGKLTNTIRTVSNGTALEEQFRYAVMSGAAAGHGNDDMVTLYSADGDRLAMTHYCSIGNQPRMATVPLTGKEKKLEFAYTGATNLPSPEDAHMSRLILTVKDKNHFDEEWTYSDHGKDNTAVFHFTRVS